MFVNWFVVDNLCITLSLFWGATLSTMCRPCVGDEVAQLVKAPWLTVANRHTPSPWLLTGSEPNQCQWDTKIIPGASHEAKELLPLWELPEDIITAIYNPILISTPGTKSVLPLWACVFCVHFPCQTDWKELIAFFREIDFSCCCCCFLISVLIYQISCILLVFVYYFTNSLFIPCTFFDICFPS